VPDQLHRAGGHETDVDGNLAVAADGTDTPLLQGAQQLHLRFVTQVPYFVEKFKDIKDNTIIVSPDLGSVTRARNFAAKFDAPLAIVDKRRQKANVCEVMNIIGDVKDKDVILVDDMIDTAGTLCNAAKAIMEKGGARSVTACATHGVLSGPAIERIQASVIKEVVILDTIALPPEKHIDKITVLPVAPVFAQAIERIYADRPISPLFNN